MPGVDGMTVLRRLAEQDSDTRVIIISAHGTVDNAVEAMKLGALDFVQKPFTPPEIRGVVADVLAREKLDPDADLSYEESVAVIKRLAGERRLDDAIALARQVAGGDLDRPEAFNLLGVLQELRGFREQAQKSYRIALDIAPTYEPARDNLNRIGSHARRDEQPRLD
jgi:DNA-binding response OmpR family regulator